MRRTRDGRVVIPAALVYLVLGIVLGASAAIYWHVLVVAR